MQKKTTRNELEKLLTAKGFNIERLGVFYLNGSDIFVGEFVEEYETRWNKSHQETSITNVKRLFRLARMTQQGLETQLFIGDAEVLSPKATLSVRPAMWYSAKGLDDDSAIELFKLLESYVKSKLEHSVHKLGLVTHLDR